MEKQKKKAEKLAQFYKISPQDQRNELDRKIDRMVARMKKSGPGGPSSGGGKDWKENGSPSEKLGSQTTPQQREERRQQKLDNSTPELRALMFEYRQLLHNRMNQRGIQVPSGTNRW